MEGEAGEAGAVSFSLATAHSSSSALDSIAGSPFLVLSFYLV